MKHTQGLLLLAAALCAFDPIRAHLNSPDIYLEEAAGPWPLIVVIEVPRAVPGEARVLVRVRDLAEGEQVAVRLREVPPAGIHAAPDWVDAVRTSADPGVFVAPMPLMGFGVWRALIDVSGPRGAGRLDIPVAARTPAPTGMGDGLALFLLLAGLFLVASLWKIARALSRDVYRGDATRGPVSRGVPEVTTATFLTILAFHLVAWERHADAYERRARRTVRAELAVLDGPAEAGRPIKLRLEVKDRDGTPIDDAIEDHGKAMHAVVVAEPTMETFLHVHPRRAGDGVYDFTFQPARAGSYKIFADLLFPSGVSETVTARLDVGAGVRDAPLRAFDDPDDSAAAAPAAGDAASDRLASDAGDGFTMRRVSPGPGPVAAGRLLDLGFELDLPDGRPVASLEPYMGMAGHVLIVRHDLDVFAHVHPTGTLGGRMAMPAAHATMTPEEHAEQMRRMATRIEGARVSFPYGFPSPGRYRLFVQVKHDGIVRTGVFDLDVG